MALLPLSIGFGDTESGPEGGSCREKGVCKEDAIGPQGAVGQWWNLTPEHGLSTSCPDHGLEVGLGQLWTLPGLFPTEPPLRDALQGSV